MTHTTLDQDGHEIVLKVEARAIHHMGQPVRLFAICDITTQSQRYRSLEKLVYIDHLTDLYNRRGLELVAEDLCDIAIANDKTITAFFIDINGLKQINDTLGHQAGDDAIRKTAQLLNHSFRDRDIKARIGGDEFVVLFQEDPDAPAEIMLSLLQKRLTNFNAHANQRFQLSISIGVGRYQANQDFDFHCLLDEADRRMYRAKQKTNQKYLREEKLNSQPVEHDSGKSPLQPRVNLNKARHQQMK